MYFAFASFILPHLFHLFWHQFLRKHTSPSLSFSKVFTFIFLYKQQLPFFFAYILHQLFFVFCSLGFFGFNDFCFYFCFSLLTYASIKWNSTLWVQVRWAKWERSDQMQGDCSKDWSDWLYSVKIKITGLEISGTGSTT